MPLKPSVIYHLPCRFTAACETASPCLTSPSLNISCLLWWVTWLKIENCLKVQLPLRLLQFNSDFSKSLIIKTSFLLPGRWKNRVISVWDSYVIEFFFFPLSSIVLTNNTQKVCRRYIKWISISTRMPFPPATVFWRRHANLLSQIVKTFYSTFCWSLCGND